jgi:transcriptional pleiotropic regulator of transition state genes
MKATGIVRKVDQLGRVVIPKELRKILNIEEGTPLEIFVNEDEIILRKYAPGCNCCDETENLTTVYGISLCIKCLREFNKANKILNLNTNENV